MGTVLALQSIDEETAAPPSVENTRYHRIRRQSRWLSYVITGLLGLNCLFITVMGIGEMLVDGSLVHVGPGANAVYSATGNFLPGSVALDSFAPWQRVAFGLLFVLLAVPSVMALLNLRALFRLYAQGIVFAKENAHHIRQIGVWLIACSTAPFVIHYVSVPLGNSFDNEMFHMDELHELVLGAVLLVVAQVMAAGHEIEQDRDQFV